MQPSPFPVRPRLADGSIDFDHYRAVARNLRTQAFAAAFHRLREEAAAIAATVTTGRSSRNPRRPR